MEEIINVESGYCSLFRNLCMGVCIFDKTRYDEYLLVCNVDSGIDFSARSFLVRCGIGSEPVLTDKLFNFFYDFV